MRVSTKIEPIERTINLIKQQALSPEAFSQIFANFARQTLYDSEQQNLTVLGRIPPHDTYVDGLKDGSIDNVRPDGIIIFEFQLVAELLIEISDQLEAHSPRLSGRYMRGHTLLADGAEVPIRSVIQPAREYVFVNTEPYARKIEGNKGRKPESSQAPDGVYELVAAQVRKRYGNVAKIQFTYRAPNFGAVHSWAKTTKRSTSKAGSDIGKKYDWLRRQPAISVTFGTLH